MRSMQLTLLCAGKPPTPSGGNLACFTCNNETVQYDSNLGKYHTMTCNHERPGYASSGSVESCAGGEVRYV